MAQRTDRERRRPVANGPVPERGDAPAAERGGAPVADPGDTPAADRGDQAPERGDGHMTRGYARGRARDEAARAALVPLAEGERPPAVTVGALLAGALASAEIVSFVLGYSPGEEGRVARSVILVSLLSAIAVGMWRASYWAVLGMQALLGLTIVLAALGAVFATNLTAVILVIAITLPASVLFWFLVKSMARLQMPRRPEVRD